MSANLTFQFPIHVLYPWAYRTWKPKDCADLSKSKFSTGWSEFRGSRRFPFAEVFGERFISTST